MKHILTLLLCFIILGMTQASDIPIEKGDGDQVTLSMVTPGEVMINDVEVVKVSFASYSQWTMVHNPINMEVIGDKHTGINIEDTPYLITTLLPISPTTGAIVANVGKLA